MGTSGTPHLPPHAPALHPPSRRVRRGGNLARTVAQGGHYETSPPRILADRRSRTAGCFSDRAGASLSGAASAYHRRRPAWRRYGSYRAHNWPIAIGATASAVHHRESAGRGGTIGAEAVVRASPDGYTLLLATTVDAINVTLYEKVNFILDVTPVASIARTPNVMVVHPSFQPETIPELIAYAKANPGKINISGGPAAGAGLIAAELFKLMAGVSFEMISGPCPGSFIAKPLSCFPRNRSAPLHRSRPRRNAPRRPPPKR